MADPLPEKKKNMAANSNETKSKENTANSNETKSKKNTAKSKKNTVNSNETKSKENTTKNKKNTVNSNERKSKKKSDYEYVLESENKDPLECGQLIVVRVHCSNFERFSQANEFEKPNDEKALNLMNSCAVSVCKEMPDIMLAYGFGHEYSFIFTPETNFYKRRASKLLSVIASLFTSSYRMKWSEFFPNKDMRSGASFEAEVLCLKRRTSDLQAYLAFKQRECYENNDLPNMLRLGSCILKTPVDDDRKEITVVHAENIASRAFLNSHSILFKELTDLDENADSIGEKQLNIWRVENDMKQDHWIANLLKSMWRWVQTRWISPPKGRKPLLLEKKDHWIVVKIDGGRFSRSCEVNEFEKTNAEKALNLMNSCALSICEEFPDIILAYGFNHEYSFIFNEETAHASELVSVIVSLFTSSYRTKWVEFFPNTDMIPDASFEREVLFLKTTSDIQSYLAFKQEECENAFGINCNDLPDKFRLGSCILKTVVDDMQKTIVVQAENIASRAFLNDYSMVLSKELTGLDENVLSIGEEHLNSWRFENRMKQQDGWIVVRIDGCGFSRFTKVHKFEKPFDEPAAELMNSCAMAVYEEFKDIIIFAYGQSDEYSFVLEKNTQLHQGRDSKIVSAICSVFTDTYVKKWKEYFPEKDLQYAPRFDGRSVCYKSYQLIRDYLSWRQVDCHKNSRSNTCYWGLVHSGKSGKTAQKILEGCENFQELLLKYGYYQLPLMFRRGSSIFCDDKEINGVKKLVMECPDIIRDGFWKEHAHILKFTILDIFHIWFVALYRKLIEKLFTKAR